MAIQDQNFEDKKETIKGQVRDLGSGKAKEFDENQSQKLSQKIDSVQEILKDTSTQLREKDVPLLPTYVDKICTSLDKVSNRLEKDGLSGVYNDFENLGRNHPGWIAGGSIAAGFLASRFLKSSPQAEEFDFDTEGLEEPEEFSSQATFESEEYPEGYAASGDKIEPESESDLGYQVELKRRGSHAV
jgi:hypothetical protein